MTIYHRIYQQIMQSPKGFFSEDELDLMKVAYRAAFSWCIPTEEIFTLLSMYSPFVEVGAGSGYWAWEMRKRGIKVTAFDCLSNYLDSADNQQSWINDICRAYAGYHTGRDSKNSTLLIVSPQYRGEMAYDALNAHKGKHFVYVGTPKIEMNCGDKFAAMLEQEYKPLCFSEIPNWPGDDNMCFIYERMDKKGV